MRTTQQTHSWHQCSTTTRSVGQQSQNVINVHSQPSTATSSNIPTSSDIHIKSQSSNSGWYKIWSENINGVGVFENSRVISSIWDSDSIYSRRRTLESQQNDKIYCTASPKR